MKSFQLPPRMQDENQKRKNRPDIGGRRKNRWAVGRGQPGIRREYRTAYISSPADDGPFFVVVEQPKKKKKKYQNGRRRLFIGSFIGSAQLFFLKRKWEPMMDEVNRIGTALRALRVGWKEEDFKRNINNNNKDQMTNEVRIFSGCVCVLARGDPR